MKKNLCLQYRDYSSSKEISHLINHIKQNRNSFLKVFWTQKTMVDLLQKIGFVEYNTPIVTHGMREYNIPIANVFLGGKQSVTLFLRHSPQFEKQLITMVTKTKYYQKAPCVRPGEVDNFHTPYLHQLDIEMPFSSGRDNFEKAQKKVIAVIQNIIVKTLSQSGYLIRPTVSLTHEESIKRFETESPYIETRNNEIQLVVIKNPPLFKSTSYKGYDTVILPMAQPIWQSDKQKKLFIEGKMGVEELMNLRVYGYDFILSTKNLFTVKKKNKTITEGIEVAGGSIRISDPEVQFQILLSTRNDSLKSFAPLIALLQYFKGSDIFTGGGAIGLERLSMVCAGVDSIHKIIPLPWNKDGLPPFVSAQSTHARVLTCVLSGGGNDIYQIFANILKQLPDILKNKMVSYVIVAAEQEKTLLQLIIKEWAKIQKFFIQHGAKQSLLIREENLEEMYHADLVIFSGGDTNRLINVLRKKRFYYKIVNSSVQTLIGISAGAIALARGGQGVLRGKPYYYKNNSGLLDVFVVPHSDKSKKQLYPQWLHLEEYDVKIIKIWH